MLKHCAIASAAILLVATCVFSTVIGQDASSVAEVRINALRLEDGRTEFALQQRELGEAWGERMLPRGRYFPARGIVDRWLSSTPLGLDGATIRIVARLREDARIEFGLQRQRDDGVWGERQLPRSRMFPSNAATGRWLSSSPLEIAERQVAASEPADDRTEQVCRLSDHADRVAAATFQVQTEKATGTAFYIGQDEWITNHHVVESTSQVHLVRGDYTINADVIGSLPDYDLALLRAPAPYSVRALGFTVGQQPLGANVSVLGYPPSVSGTPSLTRGVVSKRSPFSEFSGFVGPGFMVQIDAAINPGNSGGPMINDCGEVVGIATLKLFETADGRDVEGIGYGISGATVVAQLPALRATPHVSEVVASGNADIDLNVRIEGSERGGDLSWLHFVSEEFGPISGLQARGLSDHRVWSQAQFRLICTHDTKVLIATIEIGTTASDTGDFVAMSLERGDPVRITLFNESAIGATTRSWGFSTTDDNLLATGNAAILFLGAAQDFKHLGISTRRLLGTTHAVIPLDGVFDTPVQHLLERCLSE